MANILPRDLPAAISVPDDVALLIDNGVNVQKATPIQIVDSGRPLANQAEAEAGTNPIKAMTPLTTAQAIVAQGSVQFATAAQGLLADSAVQPGDLATVATTGDYDDLLNKPATLSNVSVWNSATTYSANDFVSYNSGVYQANTANTNKVPGVDTEWDVVVPSFSGGTLTSKLTTAASTISEAGLNISEGTAPSSPVDGDVWRGSTQVAVRLNGGSYNVAFTNRLNEYVATQKFSSAVQRKAANLALSNGMNVGPTVPTTGSFVRVTGPTGAFQIASLTGIYDGEDITIYNTTSHTMTIKHQDSVNEATGFKRIITPTGADITAKVAHLHYDETTIRWIVVSYH